MLYHKLPAKSYCLQVYLLRPPIIAQVRAKRRPFSVGRLTCLPLVTAGRQSFHRRIYTLCSRRPQPTHTSSRRLGLPPITFFGLFYSPHGFRLELWCLDIRLMHFGNSPYALLHKEL